MPRTTRACIPAGRLSGTTQPVLEIDNELVLRPWRAADADAVLAVYRDPAVVRWHARTLDSVSEALELIMGWKGGWEAETQASWVIAEATRNAGAADDADDADRALLGRMALTGLDLHEGTASPAYWTAPAARGRGVAPRALRAVSEWALSTIGFHRLALEHSVANAASCRVAVKAGFLAEQTRRSAALHADGWHDMHVHARIAADHPSDHQAGP